MNDYYWLGKRLEREGCSPEGIMIYVKFRDYEKPILMYDGSLQETETQFMERWSAWN